MIYDNGSEDVLYIDFYILFCIQDWRTIQVQYLQYIFISTYKLLQIRIPLRGTNFIFHWSSGENTQYFHQYLSCPLIKRLWGVLLCKSFIQYSIWLKINKYKI